MFLPIFFYDRPINTPFWGMFEGPLVFFFCVDFWLLTWSDNIELEDLGSV